MACRVGIPRDGTNFIFGGAGSAVCQHNTLVDGGLGSWSDSDATNNDTSI